MNQTMWNRLQNATKMTLFGITIQQTWPDLWLWEQMFNAYPMASVVEIGTKHGGLSVYLLAQCTQRGMRLRTFDINKPFPLRDPLPVRLGLETAFHQENVFAGTTLAEFIGRPDSHPLALLCDGGDKQREFRMFLPRLFSGDIIAAHDWNMEFWPHSIQGMEHLIDPILVNECEGLDSWTRFWRKI